MASQDDRDPQASTSAATSPLKLSLSHAGTTQSIELDPSTRLEELRTMLQGSTNVPSANQKIIFKGKTLAVSSNDSALSSLGLTNGSKLLLIGSKAESVSSVIDEGQALQRRYEALKQRQPVQVRKTVSGGKTVMDLNDLRRSGVSAFGRIEVLPGCPHEDLRRERLVNLSKDEAVLGETNVSYIQPDLPRARHATPKIADKHRRVRCT